MNVMTNIMYTLTLILTTEIVDDVCLTCTDQCQSINAEHLGTLYKTVVFHRVFEYSQTVT